MGNITVDLVDGTTPTGGAVSYASVVAQALGATACIITGAVGVAEALQIRCVCVCAEQTSTAAVVAWLSARCARHSACQVPAVGARRVCFCHARLTTITTPTVAGPEADLDVFGDAELYIVPANNTLTFEHSYAWWGEYR